jgi:methylated-DNA-[protein]-cysteine S-methyltransferase
MKFPHNHSALLTDSPLGPLLLVASAQGLAGVWFTDQRHLPPESTLAGWPQDPGKPLLRDAAAQLAAYFNGDLKHFDLPLDLSIGTAFQQAVWRALLAIPRGQTRSYGAVAHDVQRPAAVRAVGAAVGRNPLGIVVPCHRVVGADGSLTGYAGGLPRKVALLQLESGSQLRV